MDGLCYLDGSVVPLDGMLGAHDGGEPDAGGESDAGGEPDAGGQPDACIVATFYADVDGDGQGDPHDSVEACAAPEGYVADSRDCDDACESCASGGAESCDGSHDEDCDGAVDEGCDCTSGAEMPCGTSDKGACAFGLQRCVDGRWAGCEGAIEPMAETCNEVDDDCDGDVDEDVTTMYYRDADGDTYGTEADTRIGCGAPSGYVARAGDCIDTNATVNPGQTTYFTVPIAGAPSGRQYDYDCDGEEARRYPNGFRCRSQGDGTCAPALPGFLVAVGVSLPPACGETRSNYVSECTSECDTLYVTQTQSCR